MDSAPYTNSELAYHAITKRLREVDGMLHRVRNHSLLTDVHAEIQRMLDRLSYVDYPTMLARERADKK